MGPELFRSRMSIFLAVAAITSCGSAWAQAPAVPGRPAIPKGIKYPQARAAFPKLPAPPKDYDPSKNVLHPAISNQPLHPIKPFDVQYTVVGTKGFMMVCRFVSDGVGHVRTETAGLPFINIIDYPNRTWTILDINKKEARRNKWVSPEVPMKALPVLDQQGAKRVNAQPSGQQVVAGHPCKGYVYTTPGSRNEVWIADDIGIVVKSESSTPKGKLLTTMKGFSANVKQEEFMIPTMYKVVNTGL